ncbi:hypothetical protein CFS9_10260 [Flavobacterium sp. CFS9]|uniref:Uncharacterized protein n=1 Tax=Flavobacterium sp. CFS9 TaxID=3143118 RepID=A0AAT9GYU9_9FLAO
MLFCLSDANIIHFHNYISAIPAEIGYLSEFLAFHYEFNIIQNKKGALFPEHLSYKLYFFFTR